MQCYHNFSTPEAEPATYKIRLAGFLFAVLMKSNYLCIVVSTYKFLFVERIRPATPLNYAHPAGFLFVISQKFVNFAAWKNLNHIQSFG